MLRAIFEDALALAASAAVPTFILCILPSEAPAADAMVATSQGVTGMFWLGFLAGAPLWGSLALLIGGALTAARSDDHSRGYDEPDPRDPQQVEDFIANGLRGK